MYLRKRAVALFLVAFVMTIVGDVSPLSAECPILEPTEALKYVPVSFVGDLLGVESGLARLRVIERLKGKVPDKVAVWDAPRSIDSSPVFTQPGRYLVFAEHLSSNEPALRGGEFAIPWRCPQTRLLSDVNARQLLALQRYVRVNRKTLAPGKPK